MKPIRKFDNYKRARFSTLALLLLIGIVVVAWTSPLTNPGKAKHQNRRAIRKDLIDSTELKITSKVSGLEVTRLEKHLEHNSIVVWLKNNSNKTITGYEVGVGIGTVQTDLLQADNDSNVLRPGMETQERYAIQAELETRGFTVLAAIFEDGQMEGDPRTIAEIKQYRKGMKIERDHTVKLLRQIANAPESEMISQFANIESRLPALSNDQQEYLPFNVKIGYQDQLNVILSQMRLLAKAVKESSQGDLKVQGVQNLNLRQELQGLADRYENISRKLIK